MNYLPELENFIANLKDIRRKAYKKLSRAPEGRLDIQKVQNYLSFRQVYTADGRRKQFGIGKDPALIDQLANKRYLQSKIWALDRDIEILEKALKLCVPVDDDTIIGSLPEGFQTLSRASIILGRRETSRNWPNPVREGIAPVRCLLEIDPAKRWEWAALPYAENTSYYEYKKHLSSNGLRCRSKSEAAILGIYDSLILPYHYDELMYVGGALASPDIISCREDGTMIYHEHKGLDTEGYKSRNELKELRYKRAGLIEGRNLLFTYDREDGSINLDLIRAQIMDIHRL